MPRTGKKTIFVTASDKEKLNLLFETVKNKPSRYEEVANLVRELDSMVVTQAEKIPSNVITMNTRFSVQHMGSDTPVEYTLVYPGGADYESGRISIMSPLGAALLGHTPDSLVEYKAPGGTKQVKVIAILEQPEASGKFN